jgi:hypothetical protein
VFGTTVAFSPISCRWGRPGRTRPGARSVPPGGSLTTSQPAVDPPERWCGVASSLIQGASRINRNWCQPPPRTVSSVSRDNSISRWMGRVGSAGSPSASVNRLASGSACGAAEVSAGGSATGCVVRRSLVGQGCDVTARLTTVLEPAKYAVDRRAGLAAQARFSAFTDHNSLLDAQPADRVPTSRDTRLGSRRR